MSTHPAIPVSEFKPETFTQRMFARLLSEIEALGYEHAWVRRELPRLTVGLVSGLRDDRCRSLAFHGRGCDEDAQKKQKRPMLLFNGEYAQWMAPYSTEFRNLVRQAMAALLFQQRFVRKKTLHWKYDGKVCRKGTVEALMPRAWRPIYGRLGIKRDLVMVRPTVVDPPEFIRSSAWAVDWIQPYLGKPSVLTVERLDIPITTLERVWEEGATFSYDESPKGLRRGYVKIKNMRVTQQGVL